MRQIEATSDTRGKESQPAASKEITGISPVLRKDAQHGRVYSYLVDTLATISFWTPVAMTQEVLIAGMTVEQSLKVRGISFVVSMVTARPYGIYRNKVFKLLRTTEESGQVKRYWTDYLAFSSFWAPLYAGMLAAGGGDHNQVIKASVACLFANTVTGRPFGAYFDWVRRKAGLRAAWQQNGNGQNKTQMKSVADKN
ncbi:MAG: L-alanine exporter AlaE [Candidatus Micrarchaeota archaeon]|nr:L-alanine exporter AlaE [Candidatus Micrarchaeota archaeon]